MQTKSVVQTSANVIRITNLVKGDIYKRFDTSSYSDKVVYGIVEGIYNNGDETFIQAVEYKYSYSSLDANIKIISGTDDVSIFPASLEDLKDEFESCKLRTERDIEIKKEEIVKLEKALDTTNKLISGELQKELQSPEYKELSQEAYELKKREQEQKKLEAENIGF